MKKLLYILIVLTCKFTLQVQSQIVTGAQYSISAKQISDSIKTKVSRDSITQLIADIGSPNKVTSEYAVRELFKTLRLAGRVIGTANTYATLPTTSTETGAAVNGDGVYLNTDDIGNGTALNPQYPQGFYIRNSDVYKLAVRLSGNVTQLTNLQVLDKLSTVFGTVSGSQIYTAATQVWRDSAIVGSAALLDNGTDLVNRVWSARELQSGVNASIRRLALTNWDATFAGYGRPDLPAGEAGDLPYTTRNGKTYRAIIANVAVGSDPATDASSWEEMYDKEILRGAVAPTGTPASTAKLYLDTVGKTTYGALAGRWVQVGGSTTKWYETTSTTTNWFKRWLVAGTLASLTFDFSDPADANVVGTFTINDFATGFSSSGFYGGTAKFTNVVMSSGRTINVVIAVYPDNAFLINILNSAGTANGRISNIKLTIAGNPNSFAVDHAYISQAPFSSQVIYHTGTPATPVDASRNAIAINTTNNQTSHYWDGASWTLLAPRSRFLFWAANTALEANEPRWTVISTAIVFLHNRAARTSGATRSIAEYDQWDYVGQSFTPNWASGTTYPTGFKVIGTNGLLYERIASGTAGGSFDATEIALWRLLTPLTNPEVVYHTGTPALPLTTTAPAIAINTTINTLSHRWTVNGTLTTDWVAIAAPSVNNEVSARAPIASAQTGTQLIIGDMEFRYNSTGTNGNLEVRFNSAGGGSVSWSGRKNMAAGIGPNSVLINGNTGAFTQLGSLNMGINESLTYYVYNLTFAYEVKLINRADQQIYINVTKLNN